MARRADKFAEMCWCMVKDADPEAWREEYRKKQAAGVRFEKIGQGGLVWLPFVGGFENGNKEDYREVPQESVAPQDDQFAPTSEDGHDCEGFPGGCNRFGCPGGDKCYMLNNQTPHAAERALWKAQRDAGTNEVWQWAYVDDPKKIWTDIRVDDTPTWQRSFIYSVKPMKLTAKICRVGEAYPMSYSGQDWQFTGTREEYRAECEKYGYVVVSAIKEVVEKPKTVKYYFALIRNKFGTVDSLVASSMISFNRIAEKNSYIIIGDIEEREVEA